MGLDHVDVFYHHRPDPERRWRPCGRSTTSCAPLAPRTWRLLLRADLTLERSGSCAAGRPAGHPPAYSMLNRSIEQPNERAGRKACWAR
ncbi:hypothetical protein QJS66_20725 [Kocuria rhizophila]|nr:hypothetical protein QJS66_20725 [Kocuria rhizophila]